MNLLFILMLMYPQKQPSLELVARHTLPGVPVLLLGPPCGPNHRDGCPACFACAPGGVDRCIATDECKHVPIQQERKP